MFVLPESSLDDLVDLWVAGKFPGRSLESIICERTGWSHPQYAEWVLMGRVTPEVTVVEHAERGNAMTIVAPTPPLRIGDLCRVAGELHMVMGSVALQSNPPRYIVDGQQCVLLRRVP